MGQTPTTATTVTITLLEPSSPQPARALDTTAITRVLADAALVDRDRRAHSTKSWASKARAPTPTSTRSPRACPPTSPSMAQRMPTPRPAQRRPVLRVRHPPGRMCRRAARRRARTIPRHRARLRRQATQPGAGHHETIPLAPGRPHRHGAPAHVQTPARTRRRRGRGRGSVAGRRRQDNPR